MAIILDTDPETSVTAAYLLGRAGHADVLLRLVAERRGDAD